MISQNCHHSEFQAQHNPTSPHNLENSDLHVDNKIKISISWSQTRSDSWACWLYSLLITKIACASPYRSPVSRIWPRIRQHSGLQTTFSTLFPDLPYPDPHPYVQICLTSIATSTYFGRLDSLKFQLAIANPNHRTVIMVSSSCVALMLKYVINLVWLIIILMLRFWSLDSLRSWSKDFINLASVLVSILFSTLITFL